MTGHPPGDDTLALPPEALRQLGHAVVDLLVNHAAALANDPVAGNSIDPASESDCTAIPEPPEDPLQVLQEARRRLTWQGLRLDHPRFFAYIPGPGNPVGALADALASGLNIFAGRQPEAGGAEQIERETLDWLRQRCGLPQATRGLLTSGGSMANLTALCVARDQLPRQDWPRATVYASEQTHHSVDRALHMLGFAPWQLRRLPTDDRGRLAAPTVADAVDADQAAGHRPFCVVANAGTTATGAADPLRALAGLCAERGLWLHVDGAYGAAAVFTRQGQELLRGLELADSLTLDPHKWLFQPYGIGCVLVRAGHLLERSFRARPDYLDQVGDDGEEAAGFADQGPELSRPFRALKLWMSLKTFGADAFARAMERGMDHARLVEADRTAQPDWEVMTPAQLGIVTFRHAPRKLTDADADTINQRLASALLANGFAMVSTVRIRGRLSLRMCTINPRTTEADISETLRRLDDLANELAAAA